MEATAFGSRDRHCDRWRPQLGLPCDGADPGAHFDNGPASVDIVARVDAMEAAALLVGTAFAVPAFADATTEVALVPGAPHPDFAAWQQAGADAVKECGLGAGVHKVPVMWEMNRQSQLLECLLTQVYNSFLIFPGDAVGTTSVAQELVDGGANVIATAGCLKDPSPALFRLGTDTGNADCLDAKRLIRVMGGKCRIDQVKRFAVKLNQIGSKAARSGRCNERTE